MKDRKTELRHRIEELKDEIRAVEEMPQIAEFDERILEMIPPLSPQGQLAAAERQLAILEGRIPIHDDNPAKGQQSPQPEAPSRKATMNPEVGLSEDGRTYFTPDGPVQLSARGAEVMKIMVDQWNRGVRNVTIEFIKEEIGGSFGGDTRIRDYVGRAEYKRLLRSGEKKGTKGTVELIHPKNPR